MIRVLLPTDFSKNSFNAILYGLHLFEKETCVFYLMNAYTPPIYRVDYVAGSPGQLGLPDDYQEYAKNNLRKFEESLKKRIQNPRHSLVLLAAFNTLDDEIKKTVQNENIDLIIMGTQGATGAREIFFGSNTIHTIKKTVVPILVIPSEFSFKPPQTFLFPTDLEIDYNEQRFDLLLKLLKLWESKIDVLHVASPKGLDQNQTSNRKVLEEIFDKTDFNFHDYPDQDLLNAINQFHSKNATDILVMIRNKHTFLERLFIEPIIKNIGLHSDIPFLVLPKTKFKGQK